MAKRGRKKTSAVKHDEASAASTAESASPQTVSAEPKSRGRRAQYSEEQKADFLKSIKNGRENDLRWSDILNAVKEQGFKGSLPYLMKIGRDAGLIEGRGKRRGRPTRTGAKPGRPAKVADGNGTGLGEIDRIVAKMVDERLSEALGRAIATLESAVKELKGL